MPLLNQFGPFSDSWHVAVNSDVKYTMHGIGVHDVVVHDVGIHDIGVHDVALHDVTVHDVGMPGMAMPSMDVHKHKLFFSGKKLIFDAHLRKKSQFFLLYVAE
jgi:hypothetical protein